MKREQPQPLLTKAQRTELDRRLDAYEADGDHGRPAAEVIAKVRRILSRNRPSAALF